MAGFHLFTFLWTLISALLTVDVEKFLKINILWFGHVNYDAKKPSNDWSMFLHLYWLICICNIIFQTSFVSKIWFEIIHDCRFVWECCIWALILSRIVLCNLTMQFIMFETHFILFSPAVFEDKNVPHAEAWCCSM